MAQRPTALFAAAAGLGFLALTLAPAKLPERPQPDRHDGLTIQGNEVIQQFPSTGPMQSAWKVRWKEQKGPGLIIVDAYFKKGPQEDWIQVLGQAQLAELFVPYHKGSPRYWDVQYKFPLSTLTRADAGRHGQLLSSAPGKQPPTVVLELRDEGYAYKDYSGIRRGEGLALWGVLRAGNYRYVTEYTFRDDGLIRFRLGATGHNGGGNEWEPHMHNTWWRIDVNLDGPDHNSVELVEHVEPHPNGKAGQAATLRTPFNGGKEGCADFHPEKFTMLRVLNTQKKNIRNQPWAYDLIPYRLGNSRHYFNDQEKCSLHDFWVTRNRPNEFLYADLPKYVSKAESIQDTDVVIWYSTANHHEPRSEDGEMLRAPDGKLRFVGATSVMWSTFELRPRDFWDRTPLYPYAKSK
jgi:primary-amine oxidase